MMMRTMAATAACIGVLAALASEAEPKADARASGVVKDHFDPSVRAQDDLFGHVNGKWLKETEIPSDKPSYGTIFELRDLAEKNSRAIIEEAGKHTDDPDEKKIADLYASFMDEKRANELGLSPIQPELESIAAIKDDAGVIRAAAALQRVGVQGLFGAFVQPDSKKSDQNIVYLNQGGLGLPDESYYREPKYDALRKAYVAHVGKMLALAKVHHPDKAAAQIMAMETAIAKGHWDNVTSRDATKTYRCRAPN